MQRMNGERLAYVVVPIAGEVKRTVYTMEPKYKRGKKAGRNEEIIGYEMTPKEVVLPGGYLVFHPMGHTIRVRNDEELRRLGYDEPPEVIDMDPMVTAQSLLGKVLHAQSDDQRTGAFDNLADQVIAMARRVSGPIRVHGLIEPAMEAEA